MRLAKVTLRAWLLAGIAAACGAAGAPEGQVIFRPDAISPEAGADSALVLGRAATPPAVDGTIGEAEWAGAGRAGFAFNGDESKRTTVRALYDASNLYLAFRCMEPTPDRIRAASGPAKTGKYAPDATGDCGLVYDDDSIEVFISPDARQTVVYQFIANSIGGRLDIKYDLPASDAKYASGFKSAARVEGECWCVEFAIPWKAVGAALAAPGGTTLRMNFGRNRVVDGPEHASWQQFWGWQGPMPQAVLAPGAGVGAVRYGSMFLGVNEASVELGAAAGKSGKVRLTTEVTQGADKASQSGPEAELKAGGTVRVTAPYRIGRAGEPFDLTLKVEGLDGVARIEERGLKPHDPVGVTVERSSYGRVDGPAEALFDLNLDQGSLKDYRLRVDLMEGGKTAGTVESELRSRSGEARFTLDSNEPRQYDVVATLLDAKGQRVFQQPAGAISWAGAAEGGKGAAGRIALRLDVPASARGETGRWPVTVGVPFARGVLTTLDNVRLLSPGGEEVPVEVGAPATWDRARSSVRWLHLKCPVAIGDAGKDYTLEYGPQVKRAPATPKLRASQTEESITVDTGRLKFVVARRPFRFIESAWLDRNGDQQYAEDERVVTPGSDSGLLTETADGRIFRSDVAADWPETEKVELESAGPMEAVVRAEGWLKSAPHDGKQARMMKYVVRIVATADTALLRVFHSFILTENEEVQYRQVKLGFSLPDGDAAVADHQTRTPEALTAGAEAALVQVDHNAYRLQLRSPERGPSLVALQIGEKSEGWLMVQRKGWGLTLATRDFWQNYAKGYEVRRDAVALCPWPKASLTPLSFRPEDVVAPIFVQQLAYMTNGVRYGDGGNYTTYTYGVGSKPLGASKTHEYLIEFTPTPTPARSRLVQRLLNDPPLLVVPPAYACATEVLGRIAPFDKEKYPVEEAGFKAMLGRLEYGKAEHRFYGLINFGESYQQTTDAGDISVYRTFQNAGYGIVNDFYRGYLRSGDRDWFRYAVRRTRHARDLDHCHYGPKAGGQTEYDTLHWGTSYEPITFWTHRLFLLQDWYMTGDRRSWDAFLLACDAVARTNPGAGPKDDRHWFNQPKELILMYEATWNPRFLEMAKAITDGILLAKEQAGAGKWPPESLAKDEYVQPSLLAYHAFTKDPRVLEYLKAMLLHEKGVQRYATGLGQDLAAHLYWQTGDVSWLDLVGGQEAMRDYMRLFETTVPPPVGGLRRKNVTEAVEGWMKTWPVKQKNVFHDSFIDKGFHHTWERLWHFMAALDDARAKGVLKPYQGPNNPWSEPIWDAEYWKTVPPEKAKEWGWQK